MSRSSRVAAGCRRTTSSWMRARRRFLAENCTETGEYRQPDSLKLLTQVSLFYRHAFKLQCMCVCAWLNLDIVVAHFLVISPSPCLSVFHRFFVHSHSLPHSLLQLHPISVQDTRVFWAVSLLKVEQFSCHFSMAEMTKLQFTETTQSASLQSLHSGYSHRSRKMAKYEERGKEIRDNTGHTALKLFELGN